MENASGVIISITGSMDIGLEEVEQASTIISDMAHPDATIIWGAQLDDSLEDEMRITVVATGLGDNKKRTHADDVLSSVAAANEDDGEYTTQILDIFNK
jgi:cell division protein FtsZ